MYFRLDTYPLKDSGVYEDIAKDTFFEELTEVVPGEYADQGVWEYGYYVYPDSEEEERLRKGARRVTRYLRGSFVIFCKASWYNLVQGPTFDAYNVIHQNYQFIQEVAKKTCKSRFLIKSS
jgi:serine/threonine-protein kinase